jgi:DNA repair protein RecO (recombination protein O)
MFLLVDTESASLTLPLNEIGLCCALYVNELLLRTLRQGISCPEIFLDYLNCIQDIAKSGKSIESTLRSFELSLLNNLGYGIDFVHCASGHLIIDTMAYRYLEQEGFFLSQIPSDRNFTGSQLIALRHRKFHDTDILRIAKRLTRMALKPYLGTKPLKSVEFANYFLKRKIS